jgi:plasmid stabilization system protein ParE
VKVELSAEAEAQIDEIHAWWQRNRPAASTLFVDELDRALAMLGDMPALGTVYRAGSQTIRRLLLRRTQHHVYFMPEDDRVLVVAVWSAFRGRGPKL